MTLAAAVASRRRVAPPEFPSEAPYNAAGYLTIPTYEGSGQAVHPDVIDFGTPWNGWRFWLVMTPYPASNDDWEDPSIVVSADGITWQEPAGLTNPLYRPLEGPYNNDPDWEYDPDADNIFLIYRDYDVLKMARSGPDGITWPETSTVLLPVTGVSPCVVRDSSGTWHLWRGGGGHATATAAEGPYGTFVARTGLTNVWHFNIAEAPGGGFHMIYHDITTETIKAASSADGNAWVGNPTPLLVAGNQAWSSAALYRAAFTLHEDGDRYRVWYSGRTQTPRVWHIGYTEIPLTEWPAP